MDPTTLSAELIKQLATQGLGWLVSCLLGIVSYIFYLRQQSAIADCAAQTKESNMLRDQLQERRIEEARGYIKVFHEGTAAHEKLSAAISVRTETLQAVSTVSLENSKQIALLVSLTTEVKSEQDARSAAWQVHLDLIAESIKRIDKRIDDLLTRR